ncbi:hypothetical protein E6H11_06260 [Candidatus Bathyarchaeota archaeon]|nr:MAG: hypothetical protein E6H11_06260 [Candidatus Bathyarchaeota archaeon]
MTKLTGERTKRKTTTRNQRRRLTTNSRSRFQRQQREKTPRLDNDLFFIDVLHSPPSEILDKAG